MSENMERHLESATYVAGEKALNKATFKRDLLMVKILVVQPLRIKMFNDMQYTADNTGNLYQRSNGDWAIKFMPEDFKNEKGAAKKLYDVPLPAELSPAINEYLKEVRPVLGASGPQVFISGAGVRGVKGRNTRVLSVAMLARTRQFIPGCPGFGPHAVRHIVATDYIKNNPNGFQKPSFKPPMLSTTTARSKARLDARQANDSRCISQNFGPTQMVIVAGVEGCAARDTEQLACHPDVG